MGGVGVGVVWVGFLGVRVAATPPSGLQLCGILKGVRGRGRAGPDLLVVLICCEGVGVPLMILREFGRPFMVR